MFQISGVCESLWNINIYCYIILCNEWHSLNPLWLSNHANILDDLFKWMWYRGRKFLLIIQHIDYMFDWLTAVGLYRAFGGMWASQTESLLYLDNPFFSKSLHQSLLRVFGLSEAELYIESWSCGKYSVSGISSGHPLRLHFRSEELRALWKLFKNVLFFPESLSLSHTYTRRCRRLSRISYSALPFPQKSDPS